MKKCIPPGSLCDRIDDCGNNEDDIGCGGNLLFSCGNKSEDILMSLVCAGQDDCGNNEDEVHCFQNTNNGTKMCKNRGLFSCAFLTD